MHAVSVFCCAFFTLTFCCEYGPVKEGISDLLQWAGPRPSCWCGKVFQFWKLLSSSACGTGRSPCIVLVLWHASVHTGIIAVFIVISKLVFQHCLRVLSLVPRYVSVFPKRHSSILAWLPFVNSLEKFFWHASDSYLCCKHKLWKPYGMAG